MKLEDKAIEDKAKVVASVWGAECIQFLAALAVLPRSILKKRMNSTISSNSTEAKQRVLKEIEQILPPNQTTALSSNSILLLFLYIMGS